MWFVALANALRVQAAVRPMQFAGPLLLLSVLAAAEAAGQAPVDTTIVIRTEGSALEFLPARISVRQGLRVKLRYVNAGTLPHNIVVVRDDDDIDALADGAMRAGGDYVPLDQTEKMIAWSTLASPGQTVEITFVVPPPGEYTYVCLMSGHANVMLGRLRSLR